MPRLTSYLSVLVYGLISVLFAVLLGTAFPSLEIRDQLWPQRQQENYDALHNFDCARWRKGKEKSISYFYGVNTASSGVEVLYDCIRKDEHERTRLAIEEIKVVFPLTGEPSTNGHPLVNLVHILPNLKVIRWPGERIYHPARAQLLGYQALESKPWSLEIDRNIDPAFFVECNSKSLDVSISYDGTDTKNKMDFVLGSLTTCDNIRSLDLMITQGGCTVDESNPGHFEFGQDRRFASHLEKLKISGYDWDHKAKSYLGKATPLNVETWKSAMDWSRLQVLDIDLPPPTFLEKFEGHLTGLKSLSFRPKVAFWGDNETLCGFDETSTLMRKKYASFILALPPLESLSIGGFGDIIDLKPILQKHGNSLRKLAIHEEEGACAGLEGKVTWSRPTLSGSELQNLNTAAPHLESLEIDIARTSAKWPQSIFDILSNFSKLRNLTIHVDLENPNRTHPVKQCALVPSAPECYVPELMEPVLTTDNLLDIFRSLRRQDHDTSKGTEGGVEWLHAYSGNYNHQVGGGYRLFAHEEHNHPQRFTCRVAEDSRAVCEAFEMRENPGDDPWDVEVKVGGSAGDV